MSNPRDNIEAKLGLSGPPLQTVRDAPPRIPDHELIRRIGQGAYGEVWLARNALGTWRAVKIVYRDNFKDARPYEREFAGIRRFEPLSRSNEGFVDVLQVGRDDAGGWFYYVMELADAAEPRVESSELRVEGEASPVDQPSTLNFQPSTYSPRTLARDLHHRGRLPLEDCLELGLTLTLALGHLHRHGLIHRDVKPSNIIYVGGVPKLADIGLVTEAQGANTFVGTEGFVPPEGPTSPQADLYALGKVLYEAAMGKDRHEFPEPFTQIGTDRESVALMELNAVLLRACAPDPRKRYATAEEMHADLALLHSGGSVKRRHQFDRQFQIAKQVGAVAIAATLLIGAALLWQRQQTQKMTRLAKEKTTLATEKTKLADDLARLDAENRNRIVRLDIANGVRLLDEGDPAGALLWFADALPLLTNNPAAESIHRIRIQQTLNQMPRTPQVLAHEQTVVALAFSPDGKLFATGTQSGWVHLWDVETGAPRWKPLHLEADCIRQLRFTSEGERLLVSSLRGAGFVLDDLGRTNTATVIDVASGRQLFTKAATNLVRADFVADGRWLLTAETDHRIRVLEVRDGSPGATLEGHTNDIVMLSFSTNGNLLASTSNDGTIRLWRLPSGEPVGSGFPHDPHAFPAVLSPDGLRIATVAQSVQGGANKSQIRVWDPRAGSVVGQPIELPTAVAGLWLDSATSRSLFVLSEQKLWMFGVDSQVQLRPPIQFDKPVGYFAGASDNRRIMVGGRDGVAGLWSLDTGELLAPPFRHGRQILEIEFSPNGSRLATITDEGACVLWKLNLHQQDSIHQFNGEVINYTPQTYLHRFSPDRRRCLTFLEDRSVRLVDMERMEDQELPGLSSENARPYGCLFAPDNKQWAIAYAPTSQPGSYYVELWHEEAGKLRRQLLPHPKRIQGMGFAPDSARLATVSGDRQIRAWRTDDGTLESSVTPPETFVQVTPDAFPDGRTFFVVDKDVGFAMFDRVTGTTVPIPLSFGDVTGVEFDSTGKRFATINGRQSCRVWSATTGAPWSPAVKHYGELSWLAWSPDDKRIAMAGVTSEAVVWDAASGEPSLPPLRIGNGPLQTVTWSLDGRFLVARSDENVVRVWDSTTGEAVTPLLKHNSYVSLAHLVANNRLVTLSGPNLMRAWDLTEAQLTADVIADYAKLLAGRRLNAAGAMLPLKPDELAKLSRSLRVRTPELFATP